MLKECILADAMAVNAPDTPLPFVSATPRPTNRQTRFKLWQLQDCWHCMVIGTCLSLEDVRQAASKSSLSVSDKSDYAIHQLAVECAANKQHPLTQRLQKLLEKKYAPVIKQFRAAKTAEQLCELWSSGWSSGEVAGSLWALITHPEVKRQIIMDAFGQVHMLSHLSGASVCVDRRIRLKQENLNATLKNELKALQSRYDKATAMLREQRSQAEKERATARSLKAVADHATEQLHGSLTKSTQKSSGATSNHLIEQLREKNRELRQSVAEERVQKKRQAQEIERLQQLLSGYENDNRRTDTEALKLCGQCVLYLGGKIQQRRHIQAFVESCEGRFLHHDGGRESCPHRIAELVGQADVVMCPTDCISHGAMEKARSLCAKQDKPIVFMQRSSLSSFTRSLQEAIALRA